MKYSILDGIDKEQKKRDQLFDAILSKNIITRMIRDRNINYKLLESCLKDIEKELGTLNQPSIESIIKSECRL